MRLIIILALLTVDDRLILSVDMFFILNNPFFFSFVPPSPASVVVVLVVSASETSLLMADGLATANGAEGGLSGTSVDSKRGVAMGVADRVDVPEGVVGTVLAGVLTVEAGGVERLLSPPFSAFLKRPLRLFFSGSAGVIVLDNGEGRDAGDGVLVALAIGPVCKGVTVLTVVGDGTGATFEAGLGPLAVAAEEVEDVLSGSRSRSNDGDARSTRLAGAMVVSREGER